MLATSVAPMSNPHHDKQGATRAERASAEDPAPEAVDSRSLAPSGDRPRATTAGVPRRLFLSALSGGAAAVLGGVSGCGAAVVVTPDVGQSKPADLTLATATQLADLIRRKQVTSTEVLEAHLKRIDAVNSKLNAVVQLAADSAREAAKAADLALSKGQIMGPLHGVPMTIKDSLDTAGIITTAGTEGWKTHKPDKDAVVVKRLKAAGAVLMGKTNTPELTWAFETNNAIYGRTNNPWDKAYSPGGSSGGAAAIVAAHGSPFDIGSDTGGSIRIPSHLCGIAGLKPTSGRVPRTGHVISAEGMLQSFTTLGPLARSVEDLWLLFGIIAGPDYQDASIVDVPLGDPKAVKLSDLRVAVHTDNGVHKLDDEVANVVNQVAKELEGTVARVDHKRPDALKYVMEVDDHMYGADGGASLRRLLNKVGTKTPGPDLTSTLNHPAMSSGDLTDMLERVDQWRGQMMSFLQDFDAIICPPCAVASLKHGDSTADDDAYAEFSYTFAYNMTGWPAAVVRAGQTSTGMPIGVQIVARPFREDVVIALASRIEAHFGGYRPPPGL